MWRSRLALCFVLSLYVGMFAAVNVAHAAEDKAEAKDAKKDEPADLGWKAFVAKLFEHAAWPIVVLVIFLLFREQFRHMITRLTKFEGPGGLKGEFQKDLEKAEVTAAQANLPVVITQNTFSGSNVQGENSNTPSRPGPVPSDDSWTDNVLYWLMDNSPHHAIAEIWVRVEHDLEQNAPQIAVPHITPRRRWARDASSYDIPDHLATMYDQLRQMRNLVVHRTPNDLITPGQAQDYLILARRFLAGMAEHRRNATGASSTPPPAPK